MKKLLLLLLVLISSSSLYAQRSNLVFFSEQGERFFLVLNGIQQNGDPETNVKITDLPAAAYKVKVMFEDPKLPEMDKTVYMEAGYEYTCNIKKNQKSEYVIRLLSQVALDQAMPPAPAQRVYLFTTTPAVRTTTTTVTTGTSVSAGTSVTAGGATGVNVTAGGVSAGVSVGTTSTTVTTTTSSVSSTIAADPLSEGHHEAHGDDVYIMPGYNGPYGCHRPMSDREFQSVKTSISTKSFEDDKLIIAKQVTGSNCLLCSQIKEIMKLFSFEDTRLEYAKFAYRFAFDQGNYYQLNDAFQFSSSISDLDEYIHGRK